jgi:hypothetical protein
MFAKCIMQLLGYQTDTINFATEEFSTQSASRDNSVASPKSSKKMRHSDDVSNMSKVGFRPLWLGGSYNFSELVMLFEIANIKCAFSAELRLLKVSKSRKQFMVPSILPKMNETHYPEHLLYSG